MFYGGGQSAGSGKVAELASIGQQASDTGAGLVAGAQTPAIE